MSARKDVASEGGPFDDKPWPEKLPARVVTVGSQPRVHGYDVEADVARHHGFACTVLLALTGELPSAEVSRAFEVALQFLAPISVAEAPTHAAVVARTCAGTTSALIGTGSIALAEQARFLMADHLALLSWLESPARGALPLQYVAVSSDDRATVKRLASALRARGAIEVTALEHQPSRDAAVVAVLHACGLIHADQIEVAMVFARLPLVMAEALAAPSMGFRHYPMNLPAFRYEAS